MWAFMCGYKNKHHKDIYKKRLDYVSPLKDNCACVSLGGGGGMYSLQELIHMHFRESHLTVGKFGFPLCFTFMAHHRFANAA
jgi:hypothetical protein